MKKLIKKLESLIHLLKNPAECFYLDECMKRGDLIIGFENPLEISIGIEGIIFVRFTGLILHQLGIIMNFN